MIVDVEGDLWGHGGGSRHLHHFARKNPSSEGFYSAKKIERPGNRPEAVGLLIELCSVCNPMRSAWNGTSRARRSLTFSEKKLNWFPSSPPFLKVKFAKCFYNLGNTFILLIFNFMQLEWLNIFSVGWFSFFLLILSVWYFVIEVTFSKFQFMRNFLARYNNHLFDRVIIYVLAGIITEVLFFEFFALSNSLNPIFDFFNTAWKSGEVFWKYGVNPLGFQLISTGIFYFIILIVFLSVIGLMLHTCRLFFLSFTSESLSTTKMRKTKK